MASTKTAIEWTDKTWNPTVGCDKVSPGRKHCYAETLTRRFPNHFESGFEFTLHQERLGEPKRWRKPSRVFVNSMSDLSHERMPFEFLREIFRVMEECERHVFQVLTKRHERMLELAPELPWPKRTCEWASAWRTRTTSIASITHRPQVPGFCEGRARGPRHRRCRRGIAARVPREVRVLRCCVASNDGTSFRKIYFRLILWRGIRLYG